LRNNRPMLKNRWVRRILFGLAAVYLLLLIPEPQRSAPVGAGKKPFTWNRDAFWSQLERQFTEARAAGCPQLTDSIKARFVQIERLLTALRDQPFAPDAPEFDRVETNLFETAPLVAACPEFLIQYSSLANQARTVTKHQSQHWDLQLAPVRERLYRMLFGIRFALEEVLLQAPDNMASLDPGGDEVPSQTPAVRTHGLTLHS